MSEKINQVSFAENVIHNSLFANAYRIYNFLITKTKPYDMNYSEK